MGEKCGGAAGALRALMTHESPRCPSRPLEKEEEDPDGGGITAILPLHPPPPPTRPTQDKAYRSTP